jgi:hypothetical protein
VDAWRLGGRSDTYTAHGLRCGPGSCTAMAGITTIAPSASATSASHLLRMMQRTVPIPVGYR